MGEAKRRKNLGLSSRKSSIKSNSEKSTRLVEWLPITEEQKDKFIKLSIKASWVGIGLLILLWVVVRFIGPYAGWWTPADSL